jgi:hypothetical protein
VRIQTLYNRGKDQLPRGRTLTWRSSVCPRPCSRPTGTRKDAVTSCEGRLLARLSHRERERERVLQQGCMLICPHRPVAPEPEVGLPPVVDVPVRLALHPVDGLQRVVPPRPTRVLLPPVLRKTRKKQGPPSVDDFELHQFCERHTERQMAGPKDDRRKLQQFWQDTRGKHSRGVSHAAGRIFSRTLPGSYLEIVHGSSASHGGAQLTHLLMVAIWRLA